jgi:hypothetical protein
MWRYHALEGHHEEPEVDCGTVWSPRPPLAATEEEHLVEEYDEIDPPPRETREEDAER